MDSLRIDSHKLHFHPMRVAQWVADKDDWETARRIYPIYIEVSPIGGCNHQCTMCGVDYVIEEHAKGSIPQLDPWLYGERIMEMGALGIRSVMFAGEGEPLLHKRINDLVRATHHADVRSAFTTNGTLLHKLDLAGVSWVKVSINGGTRETYAKVHRTKESDWDRVWANVSDAVRRSNGCQIGVQMVLLPENQHEVEAFERKAEEAGAHYVVIKAVSQQKFSINRQYENFIPIVPESKRAIVRADSMRTQEIPYDKCQATPYFWAYWMSSGDLYSCSAYLLDERFNLGNLNTHTFKQIWQGEKRRQNWEYVRKHLDIHECRLNCRMDKVNRYLTDLEGGVPNVDFI
ncbi:MAG TPA: radical SAM/SPASM domain-containing protein [Burkholderiales bacterium]|nr:radical SAM/SPASM domain-containing protein [Burkholderiales bacterium]